MVQCKLCSKKFPELNPELICSNCAKRHGLLERTEPLRPRVPCARCNGTKLIRCTALRERSSTSGNPARHNTRGEQGAEYVAPLAATFAHEVWPNGKVRAPNFKAAIGSFEAYICHSCGFTELYTRDAQRIPIGPEYGTEAFDVGSDGPYR